jgi:hypothetical protein
MQSVASSQLWAAAPALAKPEVGAWPATVPSTGWSCTRSRSAARTDFMREHYRGGRSILYLRVSSADRMSATAAVRWSSVWMPWSVPSTNSSKMT